MPKFLRPAIAGDSQQWVNYTVTTHALITSLSPLPVLPPTPSPSHVLNSTVLAKCSRSSSSSSDQKFTYDTSTKMFTYSGATGGCLGAGFKDSSFDVPDLAVVTCDASDPGQLFTVSTSTASPPEDAEGTTGAASTICSGSAAGVPQCLNLDGGNQGAGTRVLLWKKYATPFESWTVDGNTHTIMYAGSAGKGTGMCVTAAPTPPPMTVQPPPTNVKVCGRIAQYGRGGTTPKGICLLVSTNGTDGTFFVTGGLGGSPGKVREIENVLATGNLPPSVDPMVTWVELSLEFDGDVATASVNGVQLASVDASAYKTGMVALGTGWNQAFFDDVSIVPLKPRGGPVEELVERRRNARDV